MIKRGGLAGFDWLLVGATLALIGVGLPFLKSAATPGVFSQQLVWLTIGLVVAAVVAAVDYRLWLRHAYALYAIALALLVFVLRFGGGPNRHWIRLGYFSIQPAEALKFALVLALARHLMSRENQHTLAGLIMPFVLTLVPTALILMQPDLGTALTLPPLLMAVVFAAGARPAHLAATVVGGLAMIPPMWWWGMKEYQRLRVYAFLDPETYEMEEAYQLLMSLAAIGSGGLLGEGLGNGRITEFDLLPEKHNDFIFGVIAEEGGFVAAGSVILLFLLIVLSCLRVATQTRDPGGRILAVGVGALLGGQALINIGVVTGLLPTTGVTLPLVSYGGSSLVVSMALVALVVNVSLREDDPFILRESYTGGEKTA